MKQKTYILIILILFSLSSSTEASTITSINVNRNDVFDSELKDHDFFIYRWGNAIHFKTRESVIRDELLYKTGDILDTLKIIESERNLRSLEFMGDVTTSLTYNTDSTEIAIDLTTSDQWTTVAGLTSEGSGGEYTYGVVLSEVNLLGWGKEVQAEYYTGNDRRGHYLYYNDPNFMRSHHYAFIDWENNGFIRFTSYGLRKPFYSLEDKQAYSINGYDSKGKIRYYYDGYELFRYDSDVSDYQATLTRSYGRDFKRNYSLSINWRKEEYSLSQNANKYRVLVPPDLIETRLNLNMLFGFYYYSTVKYLDNFGNTEDLTLGLWVEFSTGRSFDILDGNILRNYGNATIKTSFRISNNLFVSAEAGISGRYINEDYEHMRYSQRMSLYLKNSHRMISAFRILGRFYDRPDRFTVNYIGGKNGLRGYENFDLAGQNYVIANFEQRYYSPIEILTVAFGTAAFIDAGKTWYEGAGYDSEGWKSNAGIGFRFGLTKSSGFKVVRMDIAKSLTENSYYISFGTEMYFKFAD